MNAAEGVIGEYFLGDSILAAPVTAQADPETEIAEQTLWLPPGEWYDISTGMLHSGGKHITEGRMLSDLPLLVRPGTILPEAEETAPAGVSGIVRNLTFSVYPVERCEYDRRICENKNPSLERRQCPAY